MPKQLLAEVTSLPTAPLKERFVVQYIEAFAHKYGLQCKLDSFGNVHVTNRAPGKPKLGVMAHMDHPGVWVDSADGERATVSVRGGIHRPHMRGASFDFYRDDSSVTRGRVVKKIDNDHYIVRVNEPVAKGDFGTFVLPKFGITGNRMNAKVCDNLASVAMILDWLKGWRRKKKKVLGVFTRGEEIGFHGAWAISKRKILPKTLPLVILETSNASKYPHLMGNGVILRVGDRMHSFDPRIDVWLQTAAAQLAKKDKTFKYQRTLMDGGSMEASAFILDGYLVGSLALPLGNYHNRGPKGPAREYVAWSDWQDERKMLDALVDMPSVAQTFRERKRRLYAACMKRG